MSPLFSTSQTASRSHQNETSPQLWVFEGRSRGINSGTEDAPTPRLQGGPSGKPSSPPPAPRRAGHFEQAPRSPGTRLLGPAPTSLASQGQGPPGGTEFNVHPTPSNPSHCSGRGRAGSGPQRKSVFRESPFLSRSLEVSSPLWSGLR